jgi:putative hemolysin
MGWWLHTQPSMFSVATELLLIVLLRLLNGVLAMSEIAVVSARKTRLRQLAEQGDAGAAAALQLAEEPTRLLSTVQIGITLVGIFAGAFGGAALAAAIGRAVEPVPALAPYADAIGLTIVVPAITFLSLIVGELVPKRLALNAPERIAAMVTRPMQVLAIVAGPAVALLTATTEGVLRLLHVRPTQEAAITEEEIVCSSRRVRKPESSGRKSASWWRARLSLGERHVWELMTPRPVIEWLDVEDPPEAHGRAGGHATSACTALPRPARGGSGRPRSAGARARSGGWPPTRPAQPCQSAALPPKSTCQPSRRWSTSGKPVRTLLS